MRLASIDWVDQLPSKEIAKPVADDLHQVLMITIDEGAVTVPPDSLKSVGQRHGDGVGRRAEEHHAGRAPEAPCHVEADRGARHLGSGKLVGVNLASGSGTLSPAAPSSWGIGDGPRS